MTGTELFFVVLALVVVERVFELILSMRNRAAALRAGGLEVGQVHYGVMVVLHTSFLVACAVEVVLLDRPFIPWLATLCFVGLVLSMMLRYWAIATLGSSWNTRVIVVPNRPAVTRGPYRFLRHPNYVAVVAEMALLPLLHSAWLVAILFSVANAFLLRHRIRVEEEHLAAHTDWSPQRGGGRDG